MGEEQGRSLITSFLNAQKQYAETDDSDSNNNNNNSTLTRHSRIQEAIRTFENVCQLIDVLQIFSPNETVDDINTSDLKYLLSHYYLGDLEQKVTENRLDHLKRAKFYFSQFLGRCDTIGILRKEDKLSLQGEETDRFAKRDQLIARAKREKAANERLKELMKEKKKKLEKYGGDEQSDFDEENREEALLFLEISLTKGIQSLKLIDQEIQLLETKPTVLPQSSKPQQTTAGKKQKDLEAPPITSMIGNTTLFKRSEMQAGVFRPDWIQPTQSVEEFGEIQYRAMIEHEKSHPTQREEEKEKDEDQDIDNPDELKRAREWDDFKDDNPAGWGNRIGQG